MWGLGLRAFKIEQGFGLESFGLGPQGLNPKP